jgi:zinc transport system substrate-binding protein
VRIVCTVFPFYDWVRNVVGDVTGVEVLWLADNGSDLHSFQPSASDMVQVASADLVIYVGGTSDAWIGDAIDNGTKKGGMPLSSVEGVVLRPVSAESGHSHKDGHHHEEDEHLWLSLRNAATCVEEITRRLCELDGDYAEIYRANAEKYLTELCSLDASFAQMVAEVGENPRLLFADRFPFVYLTEDYGIEYRAAFSGCTTDVDADFSTVIDLARAVDEWGLRYVMTTDGSDRSLAESVIRATVSKDAGILSMESMQAVRAEDAENGLTYLSAMERNLSVLRQALGADS